MPNKYNFNQNLRSSSRHSRCVCTANMRYASWLGYDLINCGPSEYYLCVKLFRGRNVPRTADEREIFTGVCQAQLMIETTTFNDFSAPLSKLRSFNQNNIELTTALTPSSSFLSSSFCLFKASRAFLASCRSLRPIA